MSAAVELERHYRRWLRWYPTSFRHEYEEELLSVLLAGAREGQRRPEAATCVDLVINGLRLRLRAKPLEVVARRPGLSTLVVIGALLELLVAITTLTTSGAVHAAVVDRYPEVTDAEWQAIFGGQFMPHVLAACVTAVVWLGLAWTMGRGHDWARIAIAILACVNASSLFAGVVGGSAMVAQADLAVAVAMCCVQLTAVAVAFNLHRAVLSRRIPVLGRTAWPTDPSAEP